MSAKHDELLGFYRGVLKAVDIAPAEESDDLLYFPPGATDNKGKPLFIKATVEGKQWVMPSKEVLKASPWEEKMAFHPLSESFTSADSQTFNRLKSLVNVKLNGLVAAILIRLMEFAADTDAHKAMPAKVGRYLKELGGVKKVTAERLADIVKRTSMDNAQRRLVNVFVKRRANIDGELYSRGAITTFPILDQLVDGEDKIFGVSVSKRDRAAIEGLIRFVLPDADDLAAYSVGSNGHTAPSFLVLLGAFAKVAKRLNEVLDTHAPLFTDVDDLKIELDWEEVIDDKEAIEKLANCIPPLPGNVGSTSKSEADAPQAHGNDRGKRLFDEAKPTASTRREPSSEAEKPLTFAERVRRQQSGTAGGFHRQPMQPMNPPPRNAWGRSLQRQEADEPLPAWAENPSQSRTIAGNDPRASRPMAARFGRGPATGRASFSERMARQNRGGMFQGGSRGGRNGFQF